MADDDVLEVMLWLSHDPEHARHPSLRFCRLVQVIGVEATLKLLLAFGGTELAVPQAQEVAATANVASALRLLQRGCSEASVRERLGDESLAVAQLALPHLESYRRSLKSAQEEAEEFLSP